MVFRFFKDKKPSSQVAPSAQSSAQPSAQSIQAVQTPVLSPVTQDPALASPAPTKPIDWEAASKSDVANPKIAQVEQDREDDESTKLEKASAATKALTDFAQMASMRATAEDVIGAYKIFLGRLPESAQVVQQRMGPPVATLLIDFLASDEFLAHPERAKLVLGLAKRVQEKQAAVLPASNAEASNPNLNSNQNT